MSFVFLKIFVFETIYLPYLFPGSRMWHVGQFFSGVQLVWIQSFPSSRLVALPKLKNPVSFILSVTERRRDWFMPFPRALVQREIQIALSRIWTQFTNSISYDNNHYIKSTSSFLKVLNSFSSYKVNIFWKCVMFSVQSVKFG